MRSPLGKAHRITSAFGRRMLGGKPDIHNGIDLVPADNKHPTEVFATANGIISAVRSTVPDSHTGLGVKNDVTGNYVNIKTPDGYTIIYRHLKANSVCVELNSKVKIGDKIGIMGTTGQSTGIHLHYEIRDAKGVALNPEHYIDSETEKPSADISEASPKSFEVNDKVRVKPNSETYSGGVLSSFVYKQIYDVMQINGEKIVIGQKGAVTAAINANRLVLVSKAAKDIKNEAEQKKVKYITQPKDIPCSGAFAIAYRKWETNPDSVKDAINTLEEVYEIYNTVKFGISAPTLAPYDVGKPMPDITEHCSPLKILLYILAKINYPNIVFYYDGSIKSPLVTVIEAILKYDDKAVDGIKEIQKHIQKATDKAVFNALMKSGKIVSEKPEFSTNGYLLSICYIRNSDEPKKIEKLRNPERLHYTLIRKDGNSYKMIDSLEGEFKEISSEFMKGEIAVATGNGGNYLQYLCAGIWISDIS